MIFDLAVAFEPDNRRPSHIFGGWNHVRSSSPVPSGQDRGICQRQGIAASRGLRRAESHTDLHLAGSEMRHICGQWHW